MDVSIALEMGLGSAYGGSDGFIGREGPSCLSRTRRHTHEIGRPGEMKQRPAMRRKMVSDMYASPSYVNTKV
jgi:hypothetical protein